LLSCSPALYLFKAKRGEGDKIFPFVANVTSYLGLGTHLFVKVPLPGDSEETFSVFEWSCHLLPPVKPLKGKGNPVIPLSTLSKDKTSKLAAYLHTIHFLCWTSSRETVNKERWQKNFQGGATRKQDRKILLYQYYL